MKRFAPRLTDLIQQVSLVALFVIGLIGVGDLVTPVKDLGILVGAFLVVRVTVMIAQTDNPMWNNVVRIPAFFTWLYFFHRQAGVLIDDLAFPTWEREFSAADHLIFGGDLSLMAQSLYSPALTEVIQIAYSMFYVVLLALPVALLVQRRHAEVAEAFGTIAIAHVVLIAGNMIFPARWPNVLHEVPALANIIVYPFPMEGLWLTQSIRDGIAGSTRMLWDSMPSGHTCITVLMTLVAARFLPRLLWIMAPLTAMIVFATVYLRYHYGVDVIAGLALALLLSRVVTPLQVAWEQR